MLGLHPLSYSFDDYFYPTSYLHPVLDAAGTEPNFRLWKLGPFGNLLQIAYAYRMSTISICRSMHWLLVSFSRTRRQPWSMPERLCSGKHRHHNRCNNTLLLSFVSLHLTRNHVFLTNLQAKLRLINRLQVQMNASVPSHQVTCHLSMRPPFIIPEKRWR
jgi:hypothetical protein